MLMQKEDSGLLLIDVQEKLTPLVLNSQALVDRCAWLLRLANTLQVPIMVSEQYPRGLSQTVASLREELKVYTPLEKTHFSCYQNPDFLPQWHAFNKKQWIIAGIETHVCVLQTALDLKQNTDSEVFVVVDAVSCRKDIDHRYGLKRMKQAGIHLVTAEMVFFEWVHRAGTEEFKRLSQSFLR